MTTYQVSQGNEQLSNSPLFTPIEKFWADYNTLLTLVSRNARENFEANRIPLVSNAVTFAYEKLTGAAPNEVNPWMKCRACKKFIEKYGATFYIDDTNIIRSFIFDGLSKDNIFYGAVKEFVRQLSSTPVYNPEGQPTFDVLIDGDTVWGDRSVICKGGEDELDELVLDGQHIQADQHTYKHFSMVPSENYFYHRVPYSPAENAKNRMRLSGLRKAVNLYPLKTLERAYEMLRTNAIPGINIFGRDLEWLIEMSTTVNSVPKSLADTCIARLALTGSFSQALVVLNNSALGRLLELVNGGEQSVIIINNAITSMLEDYMRVTAAPNEQTVQQADKYFAEHGLETALRRRHAIFTDVPWSWKPFCDDDVEKRTGIFANVKTRKEAKEEKKVQSSLPPITMTWKTFEKNILPVARHIYLVVNQTNYAFSGLTCSVDPNAKPMHIWDDLSLRNPLGAYTYSKNIHVQQMGLTMGTSVEVLGIVPLPHLLGYNREQLLTRYGDGVFLALKGVQDLNVGVGVDFFGDVLRGELHPYHGVIESYCAVTPLEGIDNRQCQGIQLTTSAQQRVVLSVDTEHLQGQRYIIDLVS